VDNEGALDKTLDHRSYHDSCLCLLDLSAAFRYHWP